MGKHTFLAREIHTLVLCAAILRREEDIAVYIIVKHVLANQLFVHTHALKNTTHLQAINNLNTISTHLWTVSHLFITPIHCIITYNNRKHHLPVALKTIAYRCRRSTRRVSSWLQKDVKLVLEVVLHLLNA